MRACLSASLVEVRLPVPCLVVLVGPSAAGKSTWAQRQFRDDQIVSSDRLRGLVGLGEHDQRASKDAFEILDSVLERRLRRGLLTVVDTLGLDAARRQGYRDLAARFGIPCHVVTFDTDPALCRTRNRARAHAVPAKVLSSQLSAFAATRHVLADEGYAGVHEPADVRLVPPGMVEAPQGARRQKEQPMSLEFGLQIPRFTWEGGPPELAARLRDIGTAAEDSGFTSLWVMDHFLQIPQVGREWEDMLDSYTTLGFLAAATRSATLGTLVTGVTYRNVAHLGKIVATLDVLSGGRAVCGLGAAWFQREHQVYGWEFPPISERYALLEDALELLPKMWGPGAPEFKGRVVSVPEAICYPRPLQEHIPILIGGSGEKRTLRLVAQYADACNLFGDAATVEHKVGVLRRHCEEVGRDSAQVRITHLSSALCGRDEAELAATLERLTPDGVTAEAMALRVNAGTVEEQIGRFRALAEAGVQTAIVNLPNLSDTDPVERFTEVIAAFR